MIALHVPCLAQAQRPSLLRAMQRVGKALGWEFTTPKGQTCCGLPAWEGGFEDAARDAARRTVRLFQDADTVVTPSTACLTMLREHIPGLLAQDTLAAEARALAAKTQSWCAWIAGDIETLASRLRFQGRIILLDVCNAPRCTTCQTLFQAIPGLILLQTPGRCCSFSHDLSRRHPDIAAAIAETVAAPLLHSRADAILVHEPGCLWRLGPLFQGEDTPHLLHPAEFLAALLFPK